MIKIGEGYQGIVKVQSDDPLYVELLLDKKHNWFNLYENQYLLVQDNEGITVDRYKWQDGVYKPLYRKPLESLLCGKLRPKNPEQECLIDLLMDDTITVKVITGSFGSGKTMASVYSSVQNTQNGKYDRIMWVRNNVEVKDSNPIGHLKGDYFDKMSVWAMPLADHLGGRDMLETQIQQGRIEVEHLGFMRGRDIRNTIILCSEAEHLTREHVQLLLGRVAEGSILILEGDCRQIDKKAFEADNGLVAAISKLRGNRLFGYVHLPESVRSDTAKLADLLDE